MKRKEERMRTQTKLILVPAVLLLTLVGCAELIRQADDPSSPLSQGVETVDSVARGVQQTAPAAGPYGWIAGAIATVVAGATGVYKVRQKNRTIEAGAGIMDRQQRDFNTIRDVTKSIVNAIEQVGEIKTPNGESLDQLVKERVAEELKKRNLDVIGKAVISGLKAARATESPKDSS